MKSSNLLLILSVFVSLLMGCGKELSEENGNLPGAPGQVMGDFRAKIDGVQWIANKASAGSRMNGLISLMGLSSDGKQVIITLTDSGAKTYTLNSNAINFGAYVDSTDANRNAFTTNQSDQDSLAGGTVTISSIDEVNKTISGTFAYKVYRMQDGKKKVFTEGVFTNISYGTTLPPSSANDSFRVKVNGVAWPGTSIVVLNSFGKINLSSSDAANSKNVGLSMNETITIGNNYSWSVFGDNIAVYNPVVANPATPYSGEGGNLTILENNTTTRRIRGTFNFVAQTFPIPVPPGVNFTEGYFSVKY